MIKKDTYPIDLPPLVERQFEFCNWIISKVCKFPRDLRYLLGTRIIESSCAILEQLIACALSDKSEKCEMLGKLNICIQQLRYHLRLAYKAKGINLKSYHYACSLLYDIGSQIGAWKKSLKIA